MNANHNENTRTYYSIQIMYNGCQASFTYLAVLDYVLKHK